MPALLYPLLVAAGVAVCGELSAREAGAVSATVRATLGGAVATVRFETPAIRRTAEGVLDLSLTNALTVEQGGQPALPEAVVSVALPEGAQVAGCMVTPSGTELLALDGVVRHGQHPVSYSTEPGAPAEPDPEIYAMDGPYPGEVLSGWSVEQRGAQRILNVRLAPVQYLPAYDLALAIRQLDLVLTWETPDDTPAVTGGATGRVTSLTSPVLTRTGRVDYVVITSPDLLAGAGEYGFPALCAARSRGGLIATTVTTDWIYANYAGNRPDGGVDQQTRIRNFIRDAYENWGTRFVLLGGTAARVPARGLYGSVQTGGGPQVDAVAADLYYACLDGTFDFNANGVYGEAGDGEGGQDVDLTAEVYVGRFPVDTPAEVAHLVRKTLAYEQATPAQLRKICHTGEWLGFGGVSDYATDTMEQLRLGGSYDGYSTIGFVNSSMADRFDTSDNLYDTPSYWWANGEIIRRFQADYHVFNHLGHGNWNYCFRLNTVVAGDRAAMTALTNGSYFLGYSQACQAGRFDDRSDCLAETLITVSNGPAALILNTRDGWGLGYSTDGPSQRYHRNFWHELLSGNSYQLGVANQRSKENLRFAVNYYGGAMRWCYYELTLFGDPALPFGASISPLPPAITHLPLQNQLATSTAYRVAATFGPAGLYEPDSAELVWTSTLQPDQVLTTRFTQVEGTSYEALLPAAPLGATFEYAIRLSSRAGLTVMAPTAGVYRFAVTPVFDLQVAGAPQPLGTVAPPYGVSQIASGNWVEARAPLRVAGGVGSGWRCAGWTGEGSLPLAGASNSVSFLLNASSRLVWNWTNQYLLSQGSAPSGLFVTTNDWCDAGVLAGTMAAPAQAVAGGTNHQFVGWFLDGERRPLTGRATNRLAQIVMDRPHEAVARYLPEEQDADGDGVPDWWECYYYGDTARSATEDADGDGAGLRTEYLALTDPTDPQSRPMPPVITVTPLGSVQSAPPPYAVTVRIEGTAPLDTAQLVWQRNEETEQVCPLTPVDGADQTYVGILASAAASGDRFTYRAEATGRDGLSAQSAAFTTYLHYAVMTLAAPVSRAYVAGDDGVVTDRLGVVNSGTAALSWEALAGYGEYADVEPPDWSLAALGTPWTRSAARSFSEPASLYAKITSPPAAAGRSQHAAMISPVLCLGTNAILSFRYWINSELDSSRGGYCWDGGVVEISTNGGASFAILPGPYTHRISGWSASPWVEGTPCFAGAGGGWREVSFDLSVFAGRDALVRFHYGADDNTDKEGWYVDDIRVAPVLSGLATGCAWAPGAGTVAPAGTSNLTLVVDTAAFPRRPLRLPVLVRGSDPVTPRLWYDLSLDCRYLNQLTVLGTNGARVVSSAPASAASGSDFGRLLLDTGTRTQLFRVANRSDAPLTITGVTTSGAGAACYHLSDLPVELPAHTTNQVAVLFTPGYGVQEAQLAIAHSGTNGPFVLRMAGVGYGVITSVMPASGTIYGGSEVAISGRWLGNGTDIAQVWLCGVPATIRSQTVHAVWVLAGVAPAAATAEVAVAAAGLDPVVLPDGFAYLAVPPPPVADPATAITTNRFTANWNTATSATRYVLDVATDAAFDALLAAYAGRDVGDVTACLVTGLVDRTVYYYRVRALNAHGCSTNSNAMAVPTGLNVPYLLGSPPTGVVSPGAADRLVLTRLISGTNLNYEVVANSQTGLVTAVITGTNLDLCYAAGATGGTVRIVVRATNADGYYRDLEVVLALAPPPALELGPVVFNRQTGLYEQSAVVSNRSLTLAAQSVVLTVTALPADFRLYNGNGFNLAGAPEIRWTGVLPAGAAMRFLLQYYSATRGVMPSPTVTAELGLAPLALAAGGVTHPIGRIAPLAGSSFLIEFPAVPGLFYQVQYADGLTNGWRTVAPVIEAPANRVQWIDAGPPGTVSPPGAAPVRFYRVVEVTP